MPATAMPRERWVTANRMRHHLLEWGSEGPPVLLLHGFLEHAHAWDLAAPELAAAGFHVHALDWRGHGDSDWIGGGGYYHFADYTADLAGIVRALGGRAALVAHSMGAAAALTWAGTEPGRATAVVCVDALGPPDMRPEAAPDRFANWLADLERMEARERPRLGLDEATTRLRERFPRFSPAVARHMAEHGTRPDGQLRVWKFDPLHQTSSPQPFYVAQASAFWRRITCPVLYVEGEESPFRLQADDKDERVAILRARRTMIAGAGHHPHLECPEAFAGTVVPFLRQAAGG